MRKNQNRTKTNIDRYPDPGMYRPDDRYPYQGGVDRYRPTDRYPDYSIGGSRYRPDDRYPDYNGIGSGGSRYRPDDRYGPAPMFPPTRRVPPKYPPAGGGRYPPPIDNTIGSDTANRFYPENRYPDARPDSRYPEMDGRYYPPTVTGTRYPSSDNRFPIGNDRNPIFILKYGNRVGGSSGN